MGRGSKVGGAQKRASAYFSFSSTVACDSVKNLASNTWSSKPRGPIWELSASASTRLIRASGEFCVFNEINTLYPHFLSWYWKRTQRKNDSKRCTSDINMRGIYCISLKVILQPHCSTSYSKVTPEEQDIGTAMPADLSVHLRMEWTPQFLRENQCTGFWKIVPILAVHNFRTWSACERLFSFVYFHFVNSFVTNGAGIRRYWPFKIFAKYPCLAHYLQDQTSELLRISAWKFNKSLSGVVWVPKLSSIAFAFYYLWSNQRHSPRRER